MIKDIFRMVRGELGKRHLRSSPNINEFDVIQERKGSISDP